MKGGGDGQIRCFLAANLATETLRALQSLQRQLRDALPDLPLRWVPAENIHLTFKFFGRIDEAVVPAIEREVQRVLAAEPPLVFDAGGVGAFPSLHRARVLWADVREAEPPRMASIHARLEEVFGELGFEREDRPFKPHLTLARARDELRTSLAEALRPFTEAPLGRTVARELVLYRSDLRPGGAVYTALRRMAFRPSTE